MKTLEQTLEELQQLEQLVNSSSGKLTEEQLLAIADQIESAFNLAHGELSKMEAEDLIILKQQNEDQDEE